MLSGCSTVGNVVSTVSNFNTVSTLHSLATLTKDRRSFGQIIDDSLSTIKVNSAIHDALKGFSEFGINYKIYNKMLLVTGQVPNNQIKEDIAVELNKIPFLNKIINELVIKKNISFTDMALDSSVTLRIKSKLLKTYSTILTQINMHTERGVVYILGRLSIHELNHLLEATVSTGSVSDIKYFVINDNDPTVMLTHDNHRRFYLGG